MKRDMDLIRHLLFFIEEHGTNKNLSIMGEGEPLYTSTDADPELVAYNLRQMIEGGLLHGSTKGVIQSDSPGGLFFNGLRPTWAGHDFIDAARSDTIWNKAKAQVMKVGGVPFDAFGRLLTKIALENIAAI